MKVFARKQGGTLSVVPHKPTQPGNTFEVNRSALQNSFHGWLHSVAVLTSGHELPTPEVYRVPRLTALDVSRVNHATIREGESHCVWPPSVIKQFNQADVIKSGEVEHYVLRDANLNRVESKRRRPSATKSAAFQMLAERD